MRGSSLHLQRPRGCRRRLHELAYRPDRTHRSFGNHCDRPKSCAVSPSHFSSGDDRLKSLGKYELLGEVGRGGMGIVYLARCEVIGRLVALKSMSSSTTGNRNLLQAFYHEARLVSSLRHPNIVSLHDVGEEGGLPFIVMEFLDGQNLDDIIASRTMLPLALK